MYRVGLRDVRLEAVCVQQLELDGVFLDRRREDRVLEVEGEGCYVCSDRGEVDRHVRTTETDFVELEVRLAERLVSEEGQQQLVWLAAASVVLGRHRSEGQRRAFEFDQRVQPLVFRSASNPDSEESDLGLLVFVQAHHLHQHVLFAVDACDLRDAVFLQRVDQSARRVDVDRVELVRCQVSDEDLRSAGERAELGRQVVDVVAVPICCGEPLRETRMDGDLQVSQPFGGA